MNQHELDELYRENELEQREAELRRRVEEVGGNYIISASPSGESKYSSPEHDPVKITVFQR